MRFKNHIQGSLFLAVSRQDLHFSQKILFDCQCGLLGSTCDPVYSMVVQIFVPVKPMEQQCDAQMQGRVGSLVLWRHPLWWWSCILIRSQSIEEEEKRHRNKDKYWSWCTILLFLNAILGINLSALSTVNFLPLWNLCFQVYSPLSMSSGENDVFLICSELSFCFLSAHC